MATHATSDPLAQRLDEIIVIDEGLKDRTLALFDSGECETPTAVCRKIYGYKNQSKVAEITQILKAHGRIG